MTFRSSRITGIDPVSLDYGSPYNVKQAHDVIEASTLGPQITFQQTNAEGFARSLGVPASARFDAVTFCHSLWYFPDAAAVASAFRHLGTAEFPAVYVADFSVDRLTLPGRQQRAHQLAARALTLYHRSRADNDDHKPQFNTRGAPGEEDIKAALRDAGYVLEREGFFTPEPDFYEGQTEVNYATKGFRERVISDHLPAEEEAKILSYIPLIEKEVEESKKQGFHHVRSLDVWWAEFRLASLKN